MRKLKFNNVIVCEHVAMGSGNRPVLVNVYSSDILVAEAPVVLPMGIYLEYVPDNTGSIDITIDIRTNNTMIVQIEVNVMGVKKGVISAITVPSIPVNITSAGSFKVIAKAPDHADATIIKKAIIVGPVPLPTS